MSVSQGFLGNGTDGIGQGLAFVLPKSTTEAYAMQLGQQHAADLRAAALAQQKQQQLLQAQYEKQLAAQKLPEYWAQAGKPINDEFNKYIKEASDYHATTGKSPFGSPEFQQKYNDILLKARQSKELEQGVTKLLPMVASDHDGRFTEDSKKAVNDFVQGALANPTDYLGKPLPQLQGTPSDINAFNKLIKPVSIKNDNGTVSTTVPDVSAMMQQAYVNSADPRWNNLKKTQYGIDPDLGDIGGVYNPQGKRVWYTNPTATGYIADQMLANPTEPHNAEVLTKLGITPDVPYAKEKLQDAITKQNAGYGKFITDAGKYGSSLVSKARDVTPDTFYEHFAYSQAHKQDAIDDGRDKFIRGLQDGDQTYQEQLLNLVKSKGGRFHVDKDGFSISLPTGKMRDEPVIDDRKTIDDKENPDYGQPMRDSNGKVLIHKVPARTDYTITNDEQGYQQANSLLNYFDLFKKRETYTGKKPFSEGKQISTGAKTSIPTVSDQSSYDKIPKGSQYIAPDGKVYVKK